MAEFLGLLNSTVGFLVAWTWKAAFLSYFALFAVPDAAQNVLYALSVHLLAIVILSVSRTPDANSSQHEHMRYKLQMAAFPMIVGWAWSAVAKWVGTQVVETISGSG